MPQTASYGKRFLLLFGGFALIALSSCFYYQANIGLGPWDAFHHGISLHTPLSYGQASIAVGLVIILYDYFAKERLGIGSVLNIVVIGWMIDVILALKIIPRLSGKILPGMAYGIAASIILAIGIWMYVSAGLGAGPRDSLMVHFTRKSGWPVGVCRAITEGVALLLGILLGGQVGVGTVFITLLGGPMMQLVFKLMHFEIKEVKHETFAESAAKMLPRKKV
ncbi:YczE/YyaS/YitT family protein [Acidaminobacterium chupaoyuni]